MKIEITTRHLGKVELDTDNLSAPMQAYLFAYGLKQTIDDAGADPKKAAKGSRARLDAILKGEVPAGGGAHISPLVKAQREIVRGQLMREGVKAGDATKAVKVPADAFRIYLTMKLADKAGVPMAQVASDDVDAAFEVNWPKVVERAQAVVDAAQATDEIEI